MANKWVRRDDIQAVIQVDADGVPVAAGGAASTIADGADTNQGSTTDAAVVTDANGTMSGKLRGLVKWAFERMPASLGQKAMAAAFPVVVASDQSAIPANIVAGQTGVSAGAGAVAANTPRTTLASDDPAVAVLGAAADAAVDTDTTGTVSGKLRGLVKLLAARLPAALGAGGGLKVDGSGTALPVTANAGTNLNTSALALETGGNLASAVTALQIMDDWDETDRAKVNPIAGQAGVAAGVGPTGATVQRVIQANSATAAVTSVNDSASSQQLLALTAGRMGAYFFNNSASSLFIKFGTTASATDFTVKVAPGAHYEMPTSPVYTGRIDGIWSADSSGAVLITELT